MKVLPKSLFISHGGGPLPLLGDARHQEMVACLEEIAATTLKPEAIVLVSAHWEAALPTITAAAKPDLIYDYYGFPPESYQIQYPCPGNPNLAIKLHGLLEAAGIQSKLDQDRGFDHGLFVPLKLMYPEADIPCVQLSLVKTLDPNQHMAIGHALQGLSQEKILVIGSGFSFHNLKAFFNTGNAESQQLNEAFEAWLQEVCTSKEFSKKERHKLLANWAQAPGARYCHPREEHLLPLHVCYGVAESPCVKSFELTIMNKKSSMYMW
ncbi:MAG: dioxygenase [Deltaproteobacteria bacterium]|nr:dioxygenase [Deltaproteobacteria bacterium]